MNELLTNLRDKIILVILGVLGLGCLVGVGFGVDALREPLVTIVGALAMGFKGNASSSGPPAPAASVSQATAADSPGGPT